jgi:hypothetical protein
VIPVVEPLTCIRQHTSAYVSIRQHTSAYVSIRQHTSAYVSHPQIHGRRPTAFCRRLSSYYRPSYPRISSHPPLLRCGDLLAAGGS